MTSPSTRGPSRFAPSSSPSRDAGGVGRPPLGLSRGRAGAVSVGVALLGAGLFYLARAPLDDGLDRLAPATLGSSEVESAAGPEPEPIPQAPPAAEPTVPKAPSWSLVEVGESIQGAAPEIQRLLAEGRAEVPELGGTASKNSVRADRAKRRWASWGKIWKNRVAVVERTLPPQEACAVHAPMEPACETLRESLAALSAAPDGGSVEAALESFDRSEEILDRFLNPPQPEPVEEDDGTDGEEDGAPQA